MRLVSQDGTIDVPYDICAICLCEHGSKHIIYICSKLFDDKFCAFADYSTKEKALKAMEMLRDAFAGKFVFKNVDLDDSVFELLKEWKSKGVVVKTNDDTQDVQYINNAIFQFPKD